MKSAGEGASCGTRNGQGECVVHTSASDKDMKEYRLYPVVAAVFVTVLIISNIIAVKIIAAGPVVVPVAVIVFPISYIFGDVLTEVYGYSKARRVIWTGFACNLLAVAVIWLSIKLPPAPFWTVAPFDSPGAAQSAYAAILGFAPRLLAASFAGYLVGEFLNSYVLAKLKIATAGRFLWVRTISSTLVGELADTGIFLTVAFWGIIAGETLSMMILWQWLVKSAYEAAATPLTYFVVGYLKKVEKEDHYDDGTKFSPFILGD